jgi:predicted DNA-binding ribbon-helix-helix protein
LRVIDIWGNRRTIMMSEHFWSNLKSLAAFLDGDRDGSERTLEHLEDELSELTGFERNHACDEMTVIIAQLSRLKMRMLNRA